MSIDESFDAVYKLLSASRCASPLLNAKSLFESGNLAEALTEFQKIQKIYKSSRKTTLETEIENVDPSDKELRHFKNRREKTIDALDQMNDLISLLNLRLKQHDPDTPINSAAYSLPIILIRQPANNNEPTSP